MLETEFYIYFINYNSSLQNIIVHLISESIVLSKFPTEFHGYINTRISFFFSMLF